MIQFPAHMKWVPIARVLTSALLLAARDLLLQAGHGADVRRLFAHSWHDSLRSVPRQPRQTNAFPGSATALRPSPPGVAQGARIFGAPAVGTSQLKPGEDRLLVPLPALADPFLMAHASDLHSIDSHFDALRHRVRAALDPAGIEP